MKKIILVVDDMAFYRESIISILEEYPFEILQASDGKQALTLYKKHKPDIVTLDVDMPIMNGFDALDEIIKYDKEANVFMCSTLMSMNFYINTALKKGAKGYISKPFSKHEFLKEFSDFLQKTEQE